MAAVERLIAEDVNEIDVRNPVDGKSIGSVPASTRTDVQQAVERARAAQPGWDALGLKSRARILRRWQALIWQRRRQLMKVIRQETGKNDAGALIEVTVLDNLTDYYTHAAPRLLKPQKRRALFPLLQKARLYYRPFGVVGIISPWNYPLLMALIDAVPALLAGNTVVLKPSEIAPFSACQGFDLLYEAGVPHDVAQIVTGPGSTGADLVDFVDYISFTGSTDTGRKVAVQAAGRLIPYSLELGGKDPLIVLRDADLDLTATGVLRGALENAGQACISTERIYVEEPIYAPFIERIRYYIDQIAMSAADGFDVHVGSLTNEHELLRCEEQIADAVGKGAEMLYGGRRREDLGPLFFEPTLLVNVNHTMAIMCEETFGPLVPIMCVRDEDEAIARANDSSYGLSAAIFTKDLKRGERLASRIESGDVSINRAQMVIGTPSLPMGGRKNSGVGRRNGPEGLLRFVTTQSILVDTLFAAKPTLTQADPLTLKAILAMRRLRRMLPFLRS